MNNFPYHKAIALINLEPNRMYGAEVDGHFVVLAGTVMKGFLLPSDTIVKFVRY